MSHIAKLYLYKKLLIEKQKKLNKSLNKEQNDKELKAKEAELKAKELKAKELKAKQKINKKYTLDYLSTLNKKELLDLCEKNNLKIHKKTIKSKIINCLSQTEKLEDISDFEDSD